MSSSSSAPATPGAPAAPAAPARASIETIAHAVATSLSSYTCVVAGSAALHAYLGKPAEWTPGDYDLFCFTDRSMVSLLKPAVSALLCAGQLAFTLAPKGENCENITVMGHTQTIQVIRVCPDMATTVTELLDKFDMDVCRVAYKVGTPGFLLGETFSAAAANKREPARLNENACHGYGSVRADKYRKRGFEVKPYKGPRYAFSLSGAAGLPTSSTTPRIPSCGNAQCATCP